MQAVKLQSFSFMGIPIIESNYIPKYKKPIKPHTDDMRVMFETLEANGAARQQYTEHDQVLFINGHMFGDDFVVNRIIDVTS